MADTLIKGTTLIESVNKVEIRATEDSQTSDFILSDLTTDGTWRSLDLSAIVPQGTEWVIMNIFVKDDVITSVVSFNGNDSGGENKLDVGVHVANEENHEQVWVKIASSRKLFYNASNTTWTDINFKIAGYL